MATGKTPEPPAVEPDERTARLSVRGGRADEQAAAVVIVEERPPDPATVLHRLRTAFPTWGFLHDPCGGRWIACRGRESAGITIVKGDHLALRMAVSEAGRDRSW